MVLIEFSIRLNRVKSSASVTPASVISEAIVTDNCAAVDALSYKIKTNVTLSLILTIKLQ